MLAIAMVLDAAFGEPDWLWSRLPHPVILMGRIVAWLEGALNRGAARRLKGVVALFALCVPVLALAWLLSLPIFVGVFEVLGAAILLAQRSLMEHVRAVADGLRAGLPQGRAAVAMIVGRDPEQLDEPGIARAAIESAAENFSDGVVAPAFWFAVAGLPGLALYKAVNTADSMIGHRSERFRSFGWASARLDDLLNLVPARLSGLVIALVGRGGGAISVMQRDAGLHRSPNAGWPEAATAASLGVSLSGPRSYDGRTADEPWVFAEGRRDPGPDDIDAACRLLWRAWGLCLAVAALGALLSF